MMPMAGLFVVICVAIIQKENKIGKGIFDLAAAAQVDRG